MEKRARLRVRQKCSILLYYSLCSQFLLVNSGIFVRFLRGGFHGTIFTFQEMFSLLLQELFYSSLYSFRRTYILDFKRISVEFLRRVFREINICLYLIYGIVGSLSFIKDFLPCFWRNFRFTLRSLFFRPTFFGFSKNFCLIFDGSF